jgi:dihydropyrimidinase
MTTLIKGGTVVTATESFLADVLIEGETIAAVRPDLPAADVQTVDAAGKLVLPGGIDAHTHLDMPLGDISSSDDFFSGHVAAAFGGTTTHIDFANQSKGETLRSAIEAWHEKARDRAIIDYGFHVTVTDVNEQTLEEIATLPPLGITTIKMLMAYKGRVMVDDASLFLAMERARDVGLLTMVHCENGDVIDVLVRQALAEGRTEPRWHPLTRPPQLEGEATGRAIAMAEILGAPLYVVHVTCEPALARIREARARGVDVRAETCVQYVFFTKDDLDRPDFEGAKWVCSPPFRERRDQEALWTGLAAGDLDAVSTDHCPFWFESEKVLGRDDFSKIPNGCPGIEDRLQVLHEAGVRGGRFDINRFVALTATEPARIFGLERRKGAIVPGLDADIAVWDQNCTRTISVKTGHSRVDYNLYEGMTVQGVPEKVFLRGRLIVDGSTFLGRRGDGRYIPRQGVLMEPPVPQ